VNTRPKILLVNGPPRAGKDTFGRLLKEDYQHVFLGAFAHALKVRTHGLYGCAEAPAGAFEEVKDKPHRVFRGLTPRQAYILVSEKFYKVHHGDDVWGRILAEALQWADGENEKAGIKEPLYVITDSGFEPEARCLIELYGKDAVQLVRLHREGCDFSNDSRSYIRIPEIGSRDIYANDMEELGDAVFAVAAEFGLTHRKEKTLEHLTLLPGGATDDPDAGPRPDPSVR
jgi:hypothetical protein